VTTTRECVDCGEPTHNPERCRDCDIEMLFAQMECSVCTKLRTARDAASVELANALYGYGHRCECDPPPPSKWDADKARLEAELGAIALKWPTPK
jgi:hypothetical protein